MDRPPRGSVINWFKQLLGAEVTYDQLNTAAAQLPPGSEGGGFDHFQGNHSYTDPDSRGVIAGLTPARPAHIFRAMLEGIASGTELILQTMRANGFAVGEATMRWRHALRASCRSMRMSWHSPACHRRPRGSGPGERHSGSGGSRLL